MPDAHKMNDRPLALCDTEMLLNISLISRRLNFTPHLANVLFSVTQSMWEFQKIIGDCWRPTQMSLCPILGHNLGG